MLYLMPGRASQTNYRFAGWLTKSPVGVEKGMSERNVVLVASAPVVRIASPVRLQLCCSQRRFCSLAEEADQSLALLQNQGQDLAFFRLNKEFWDCRVSAGLLIGYGWPQHLFGFMSDSFIVKSSFLVGMVLCMPRASNFRSMVLTIASRSAGFVK